MTTWREEALVLADDCRRARRDRSKQRAASRGKGPPRGHSREYLARLHEAIEEERGHAYWLDID